MRNDNGLVLGWDVGGTKCAAVVGDQLGTIHRRDEWATSDTPSDSLMIAAFIERAHQFARTYGSFVGVGVSIGGPLNMKTGVIYSPPHLPGWREVPLKEIISRELASLIVSHNNERSVVVQHDAAACLLAEVLWGAARDATHAIYLTCATGCGCGVLVDGRILCGPHGESPEIGFAKLADSGPVMEFCGVSQSAHVEIYGSGSGLTRLASFLFPSRFTPTLTSRELGELFASGDSDATTVISESARRIGRLCVTLGSLFSPQFILLGSLARYLGPRWTDEIRSYFEENSLPTNSAHTVIQPASLGERLQDLSSIAPVVASQSRG